MWERDRGKNRNKEKGVLLLRKISFSGGLYEEVKGNKWKHLKMWTYRRMEKQLDAEGAYWRRFEVYREDTNNSGDNKNKKKLIRKLDAKWLYTEGCDLM